MDEKTLLSMKQYMGRIRRDEYQKVYAPLAECYFRTGLLGDAKETALEGLEIFPSYLLCREVLGKIYFKLGNLDQARRQLEKVARIVKNNSELSRILGKLYMQLGLDDLALEHFEFVVKKDPFDFEIQNLLLEIQERNLPEPEYDPDDKADGFSGSQKEKVTDIEAIIAQLDEPEVSGREKYSKATDRALDFLEEVEDDIDAKADKIYAYLREDEENKKDAPVNHRKVINPEIIKENRREIHAAALIGQLHMELHLLDEALIIAKKLLKQYPEDQDLQLLYDKFEQKLCAKEEELDDLEGRSLATGL